MGQLEIKNNFLKEMKAFGENDGVAFHVLNLSSGSKHVFSFTVSSFPAKDFPISTQHVPVDLLEWRQK
jgi:hypothetical protein